MGYRGPFQDNLRVRVEGVSLARGARVLCEGLSFEAGPGALVEIRGANGTGKTTLLRAIAGFLKPRDGRVTFEGVAEPALGLHFVGHRNGLKPSASVAAHMRYWAGLLGGDDDGSALEQLDLARQRDLPARALSQGQARRLALARLMLARRPLWLLDEPAAALDAAGRAVLAGLLETHLAQGGLALAAVHEPLGVSASATVTL